MSGRLKITVMRGGWSAEREVSLRSGAAVIAALRSLGHEVIDLDPPDEDWVLRAGTDVVFLALHGTYGEDGTVQKRLETLGVPFTGCDSRASRLAFDKVATKENCRRVGVPVARWCVLSEAVDTWPDGFGPPAVLKPVCQGSSVGLHFVDRIDGLKAALAEALRFGPEVMVEEKIEGREVTAGLLGDETLPVVEVCPRDGAYDYAHKYTPGATLYRVPADFSPEVTRGIQSAARAAFQAVGARDYARVDFMVRPDGTPVVLEVNTLPGMTETSLLPMAAKAAGIGFPQLCARMAELALARREDPMPRV